MGVEVATPIHHLLLQASGGSCHLRTLGGILGLRQRGKGAKQGRQQHSLAGHQQLSFQSGTG